MHASFLSQNKWIFQNNTNTKSERKLCIYIDVKINDQNALVISNINKMYQQICVISINSKVNINNNHL